ncbi:pimeloyl-ACP methyl ester carboxylesterase [Bradyrhizobium sp. GM6.1]
MEKIREKFGVARWMVVGGSWGATLALAYAQAHPERVSGIALRATFLGTRAEVEIAFTSRLSQFYPALYDDFLSVLPVEERAQPVEAYYRRILDPDPAVHGPASRAWHDTERALSEHKAAKTRLDLASLNVWRTLPATPFHGGALFRPRQLHDGERVVAERRQARRHSRHHRPGPLRSVVPSRDIAGARESVAGFRDSHRGRSRPFAL